MATTVTPAATASFQIGPFDTLTLSSGGARGSIALTSQAPKLCADATLSPQSGTYGPWGAPMSVVMTITQGACDYTVNVQSLTASAAQALVSGAGNTLAIIGDSFSARWYNASGLTVDYQGKGFITWALAKIGGGLTVTSDTSIGQAQVTTAGSPTTALQVQIDTAVASGAKDLLMMGGINDVLAGVSSDTIKAAWLEILTKAKSAGMRVWWCTQPGLDATGAGASYTAARQAQIFELNRWIKQQANTSAARRDVTIIDLAGIVQDPTSATGSWRSGYLNATEASPRLHPSQPGAMAMGFEVARVWAASGLASPAILPTSNVDNKAYNAASNILNSNGLFATGAGTATGYTTSLHNGLGSAPAVTPTLVARADGYGNDQVLTGTWDAEDGGFSLVTADLKASLTLGKWYRLVCELTTESSTALRGIRVQLSASATASATANWGQLDTDSDPDAPYAQELAAVVPSTKPFQYTAALGTVSNFSGVVRAFGSAAGGTTLKIGRLAIEEVAAP